MVWDLERNEVELAGVRFRLLGPVQKLPVAPFSTKITVGDYTRDSELVTSSWILSDFRGGFGVEFGTYPKDQDRFFLSTLETRFVRALTLPLAPAPLLTLPSAPVQALAQGTLLALDEKLYDLETLSLRWTAPGRILDLAWGGDRWALAIENSDLRFWTGSASVQSGISAFRCTFLGGWCYAACRDGKLRAWNRSGWDAVADLPVPWQEVVALLAFPLPNQAEETLFLLAQDGLWYLDRSLNVFFRTQLSWPKTDLVGRPAVWRGELFLPLGRQLLRWNGVTVTETGPNREEALPPSFPDRIRAAYGGTSGLVLFLSGQLRTLGIEPPPSPATLSSGWLDWGEGQVLPPLSDLVRGTALVSVGGASWHFLAAGQVIGLGQRGGTELLLLQGGNTVWAVTFPTDVQSPYQLPEGDQVESGELWTPWFDASWAEIDKVGVEVHCRLRSCPPGSKVRILLEREDGALWTVGTVTEPGYMTFPLERQGVYFRFRRCRFRVQLERGATPRGPVLEYLALSFLRRPKQRWAYNFTLDLSEAWRGKSAEELAETLLALFEQPEPFVFRAPTLPDGKLVVISRLQWAEVSDLESFQGEAGVRGRAALSLIEVS